MQSQPLGDSASSVSERRPRHRYYDFIMAAFVTVLLCANFIGAGKVFTIFGITSSGGILFFPLSYLFGDILTEVYGYAKARRVVWTGMVALVFGALVSWLVIALPPAATFQSQAALETVFGATPRLVAASILAYLVGEFTNSYVLARLKVATQGRYLWLRAVGSTVVGEALDSAIFYPIAFYAIWPNELLFSVAATNYVLKVMWEVLATPLTYKLVHSLKNAEQEDYFDRDTKFTPFSLKI